MTPSTPRTILVIDDDDAVRRVLVRRLQLWGFEVIGAAGGAEGVRMAGEHVGVIDLLITDLVMPEVTGAEAAALIAAIRPEIPIAFMSGYGPDDVTATEYGKPNRYFLKKPFESQALRELLDLVFHGATPTSPADGPLVSSTSTGP